MLMATLSASAIALTPVRAAPTPAPCAPVPQGNAVSVPVDVIGGRLFARWSRRSGGELRFYLDTGGGFNQLAPATVHRLGLAADRKVFGSDTIAWVRLPRDIGRDSFPAIPSDERFAEAHPEDSGTIRLLVSPATDIWEGFAAEGVTVDGILGPVWFADRVWSHDYPNRRLYYYGADPVTAISANCWVPLGFQVDSAGRRTMHFPRITAVIDGDSVEFLLDTGAMTTLTDSAWRAVEPGEPRTRATSFIVTQRLDRWHARHPDWPVILDAEKRFGARMIRVPLVEVGGQRLGPVWFTERPNGAFHQYLSQWMDRRVDGALGGSAWRSVTLVIDYPRSRAAVLK